MMGGVREECDGASASGPHEPVDVPALVARAERVFEEASWEKPPAFRQIAAKFARDVARALPILAAKLEWSFSALADETKRHLEMEALSGRWQPIETHATEATKGPYSPQVLCAHSDKKWRRFGRYDQTLRRWYYSGTDERSQWSQIEGDEPTHWMPLPTLPQDSLTTLADAPKNQSEGSP